VPVASFASSILSSKDHPSLVIGALQLVDLLLQKLPAEYRPVLRREGVFHEIESLAAKTLSSVKLKDSDATVIAEPAGIPIHVSSAIPGYKKLHSLSLEPEDAITLRARVIRFKYSLGQEEGDEDNAFEELRRLVDRLAVPDMGESVMMSALRDIADHFTSHSSVSSFELLQSGAVDGLLRFATDPTRSLGENFCRIIFKIGI
jgi:E3 ubiquitin-protein ligase TRIP12